MKGFFVLARIFLSIRQAFLAQFIKSILKLKRSFIKKSYCTFYIHPLSNFDINLLRYANFKEDMKNTIKQFLQKGYFLNKAFKTGVYSFSSTIL